MCSKRIKYANPLSLMDSDFPMDPSPLHLTTILEKCLPSSVGSMAAETYCCRRMYCSLPQA